MGKILFTNPRIVANKIYKLSFGIIGSFLFQLCRLFSLPSIVSTWIMVRKLNSRKVNNCCIHMKYSVNGRQPENNFLWDKSTILSTVSIWEINYGRSNITVHLMSTKDLVLNLLNSGNILVRLTNSRTKQLKSYRSLPFYQLGYYWKRTDAVNQKLSCPKQASLHYGLLDQSEIIDMAGIQD